MTKNVSKKVCLYLTILYSICSVFLFSGCQKPTSKAVSYGIGQWDNKKYGNHRAVVEVTESTDAAIADITWRRRDLNPEKKNIIIIDAQTNEPIKNIKIASVTNYNGQIIFEPKTVPGKYYIYYMPYQILGSWYLPTTVYKPFESQADAAWLNAVEKNLQRHKPFAQCDLLEIQAVSDFDRFDPMEIVASDPEVRGLLSKYSKQDYLIFPEDRKYPIRMNDHLPLRWIKNPPHTAFSGSAQPNEYYCFQLGLYAFKKNIKEVQLEFSPLKNKEGHSIEPAALTCFNLCGVDYLGRPFEKQVDVADGKIQPLWIGVDIPQQASGLYCGFVTVHAKNTESQKIAVMIDVSGAELADRGDSELWRHSRLRWLNSTMGIDDSLFAGYPAIKRNNDTLSILGRDIVVGENGLPSQIISWFSDTLDSMEEKGSNLLTDSMRFVVEAEQGPVQFEDSSLEITEQKDSVVTWKTKSHSLNLEKQTRVRLECDGHVDCVVRFKAQNDIQVKDMYLEIPMQKAIAEYMMGMKHKGGYRPQQWQWDWKDKSASNMLWTGTVNAGLHLNLKHLENVWELFNYEDVGVPVSWANKDKGGCRMFEDGDSVIIKAYSGPRTLKAGEELAFRFTLLITPFKLLNSDHWNWRYCHDWHDLWPLENVVQSGATMINIHQANELDPYINYPFLTADKIKAYVDKAKKMGIEKVKLYYTVRELTNHMVELWAIRSLNGEIFRTGSGFQLADHFDTDTPKDQLKPTGGPWLREHLIDGYVPAWHEPRVDDEAIASTGLSRWHNYYTEGLSWLIHNTGIDGLYLDGIGYDRQVMKRLRKTMDAAHPGCLIDFHSGNSFHENYGWTSPACLYMEHFPMIDSLWLGEGYIYNQEAPDYWLVEISGMPYGLFSEMLYKCGNPWRGMIYGMSTRLRWVGCDPTPMWNFWDEFGIEDAQMIGYWSKKSPVHTDQENVLATSYVKDDKTLVVLASWADEALDCQLQIDWDKLGLCAENVKIYLPEVETIQTGQELSPMETIKIEPLKGAFIIIEKQ